MQPSHQLGPPSPNCRPFILAPEEILPLSCSQTSCGSLLPTTNMIKSVSRPGRSPEFLPFPGVSVHLNMPSDTQACSLVVPSPTPKHIQLSSQTRHVLNLLLHLYHAWLGPGLCLTHMSPRLLDTKLGQKHLSDIHSVAGLCSVSRAGRVLCYLTWVV